MLTRKPETLENASLRYIDSIYFLIKYIDSTYFSYSVYINYLYISQIFFYLDILLNLNDLYFLILFIKWNYYKCHYFNNKLIFRISCLINNNRKAVISQFLFQNFCKKPLNFHVMLVKYLPHKLERLINFQTIHKIYVFHFLYVTYITLRSSILTRSKPQVKEHLIF